MKYKVYFQENSKIKCLKTDSLDEEYLPENVVEIKKNYLHFIQEKNIKNTHIKNILYELSIMLESKILLDEALEILIKKEKNSLKKEFLKALANSFSNSQDILLSLEKFKISPLVKSFFKITQNSGNPEENIKALSRLLSQADDIKRNFIKVLFYPLLLCIGFLFCLIGIFKFVVPNFQSIFEGSKIPLSFATKTLFWAKEFYENYFFSSIFVLLIFVGVFIFLYKQKKDIRIYMDKLLVKNFFIFSTLYKMKNFYHLFLIMEILLKNKYSFHDSLSKSKALINNEYLLDKITQIENLLKSGKSISFAFESAEIFDDLVISLLKTGEVSNSIEKVVFEIKNIYKRKFDDKLKFFSLLIEPLFFIVIMALIVWIVLAIFVPLWSMNDMLKV